MNPVSLGSTNLSAAVLTSQLKILEKYEISSQGQLSRSNVFTSERLSEGVASFKSLLHICITATLSLTCALQSGILQ